MTRLATIAILLLLTAPASATDVKLSDGTRWTCSEGRINDQAAWWCGEYGKGYLYEGYQPLTDDSWKNYQYQTAKDNSEAACFCSRQTEEGKQSPNSILCTGAFSPYELRKRKKDPCAGAWEKP